MKYLTSLSLLMLGVSFAIVVDVYIASAYSASQSLLFKIKPNAFNLELIKWLFFYGIGLLYVRFNLLFNPRTKKNQ